MEHMPLHFSNHVCGYCRANLEKGLWFSEWGSEHGHHYKSVHCSFCRRKNWVKVHFDGSGHDSIVQGSSTLESTVRTVLEK